MTASATLPYSPRQFRPLIAVLCFGLTLVGVNLLNDASMDFSLLCGLFAMLTFAAVRACGGYKTFFGAVIAYIGFQHVIFACFAKFLLGQPIMERLDVPILTMEIYCVGMASMAVGGYFGSRLARSYKRVLFVAIEDAKVLRGMAWAGLVGEIVQYLATRLRGADISAGQSGGLLTVLTVMAFIPILAVGCATATRVISSGGKKSFDWLVLLTMIPPLAIGLSNANRADASFAIGIWPLVAISYGYRFRPIQLAFLAALVAFALYVFFPYARYARTYVRTPDFNTSVIKSVTLFEEALQNPSKFQDQESVTQRDFQAKRADSPTHNHWFYYWPRNETLSRFSLMKNTDMLLLNGTRRAPLGWQTTLDGLRLATPSVILEDKPLFMDNNMLMHMVPEFLSKTDFVTQPNTGPFADSYLSFRWPGVMLVLGIFAFLYQAAFGYLFRLDLRRNVLALAFLPLVAHVLSESTLDGPIVQLTSNLVYSVLGLAVIRLAGGLLAMDRIPFLHHRREARRRAEEAAA